MYISYLLLTFCLSTIFFGLNYIGGERYNYFVLGGAFVFGLFYVHFVIIKLPFFNKIYNRSDSIGRINITRDKRHHSYANLKAAPVIVGLVSGYTWALFLYLLGGEAVLYPSLCAALSAGGISLYYEPKFY